MTHNTCMAGLSFPVNMYPGQGLNCLVGLLLCDAFDDLASLCSALCRSHEPLKHACTKKVPDSFCRSSWDKLVELSIFNFVI